MRPDGFADRGLWSSSAFGNLLRAPLSLFPSRVKDEGVIAVTHLCGALDVLSMSADEAWLGGLLLVAGHSGLRFWLWMCVGRLEVCDISVFPFNNAC